MTFRIAAAIYFDQYIFLKRPNFDFFYAFRDHNFLKAAAFFKRILSDYCYAIRDVYVCQ